MPFIIFPESDENQRSTLDLLNGALSLWRMASLSIIIHSRNLVKQILHDLDETGYSSDPLECHISMVFSHVEVYMADFFLPPREIGLKITNWVRFVDRFQYQIL